MRPLLSSSAKYTETNIKLLQTTYPTVYPSLYKFSSRNVGFTHSMSYQYHSESERSYDYCLALPDTANLSYFTSTLSASDEQLIKPRWQFIWSVRVTCGPVSYFFHQWVIRSWLLKASLWSFLSHWHLLLHNCYSLFVSCCVNELPSTQWLIVT